MDFFDVFTVIVIAGHSRSKNGVASARLCPAIHRGRDGSQFFDGCEGQARA
jgi:hypothetical protein